MVRLSSCPTQPSGGSHMMGTTIFVIPTPQRGPHLLLLRARQHLSCGSYGSTRESRSPPRVGAVVLPDAIKRLLKLGKASNLPDPVRWRSRRRVSGVLRVFDSPCINLHPVFFARAYTETLLTLVTLRFRPFFQLFLLSVHFLPFLLNCGCAHHTHASLKFARKRGCLSVAPAQLVNTACSRPMLESLRPSTLHARSGTSP